MASRTPWPTPRNAGASAWGMVSAAGVKPAGRRAQWRTGAVPNGVVFLNPSGQIGGAERNLLDVMAGFRQVAPDWPLHLIASAPGPLVSAAKALGAEATVIPLPASIASLGDGGAALAGPGSKLRLLASLLAATPGAVGYLGKLRSELRRLRPRFVQTNGFKMHVLGAWAKPAESELVWHVHDFVTPRPLMSRLVRAHAPRASVVVANSDSVAADVRTVCGERVRVERLYYGIDLDRFSPEGETADLDRLAGLEPPDEPVVRVGLVAIFAWWKGHEAFLQALARVRSRVPFRAYVVGGPVYETRQSQRSLEGLRSRAAELGLTGRVGFTGLVPDTAPVMRALDVVVHASTEPEPFGLVIAEGMACGRVVVASAGGGAAELIRDSETALAHMPGDVDGLARALQRVIDDAGLRSALASTARRYAEEAFDRRRMAAQLLPIYESTLKTAP